MDERSKVAVSLSCQLGEGLHWQASTGSLLGVDIHGCMFWRWALDSHVQIQHTGQRIGWVLPTNSIKFLLGLQGGFALADAGDPAQFEWLHQPFMHNLSLRLNDAKADNTGAVWAGSLNNDDESQPDGCLFRLDTDGQLTIVDTGYTVANGPAINADSTLMLHTDSGRRTIYAFDMDAPKGQLLNKRVWKVFAEAEGYPDGMCFDAEGCVWVAHWGGGCVSRFDMDGTLLNRVSLPTSNVTNVCFGGVALDRLFVSTARVGLSPEQLQAQPDAGNLFEIVNPGVKGLPSLPARIL
jgi:sugar lactone lactonase YvrE